MRISLVTSAVLVAALTLSSCGDSADSGSGSGGDDSSDGIRPGVLTDIAGLGDRGFNDLAATGLKQAEDSLGVTGKIIESQTAADYPSNLAQLAESGAAPVFGIGFTFFDAVTAAAAEFPDTHFGIVDSVVDAPNVASLVFREEEGSYLAGVVAGLMTQEDTDYTTGSDKVVGFIGGQEAPLIEKFGAGFKQGVLAVCADCEVLYQYIGSTTEAFADPGTAAEIASNMRSNSADVIYHASGGSGDGLFKVATEEGFFAIGVNTDQATIDPEAPILTSMLKRVDTAVASTIEAESKGEFKAGVQSFGLAEDGIALAGYGRFEDLVPDAVKTAVEEARAQIIDGTIVVPTTLDEVK